jgi:hypothetical protein
MGEKHDPTNVKPISLAPLSVKEALRRAMNATPPKEDAEPPKPQIEPETDKPQKRDKG